MVFRVDQQQFFMGRLAGLLAGKACEDLVRERLFPPLAACPAVQDGRAAPSMGQAIGMGNEKR